VHKRPATPQEAKALANPLRWRILRLCLDRALTNKQLAERLGRDPGTVLHHVRVLVDTGFLAPEEVRPGARGALERPYRSTGKTWDLSVGPDHRPVIAMIDAFRDEFAESRPDEVIFFARLGVRLSPAGVEELEHRLQELIADLHARDQRDGVPIGIMVGAHRRR
jgi:DNA-binding transcriptional ArsR family regulator